jgi:hypothetical protein
VNPLSPYLTLIPSREPRRKAHEHLKDVRRAVAARLKYDRIEGTRVLEEPVYVYRWSDEKGWVDLWKLETDTREDELPWN